MQHQLAKIASAIAALLLFGSAARADIRICNEFPATIHVALAGADNGSYAAAGWWTVSENACQDVVGFTVQGDTIYYSADSDDYKSGRDTKRDHWGNKLQLFVSEKKFDFTDADKPRRGAKAQMFSSATMSQQPPSKDVAITLHFKQNGTSIEFKPKQ